MWGFQFLLILDLCFHAVVVVSLGKDLLFKSVLGHCAWAFAKSTTPTLFLRYWCIIVSFDWFLSDLEWIPYLELCLLKLLIFFQKLLWNIKSRLNSSTIWAFEPISKFVWSKSSCFVHKASILIKCTSLKTQNVEELSLDLIIHDNFW